jgi:enoyl-CoA hydratase
VSDPRIRVERDGAVATITLDRPERLNALDAGMVAALGAACAALDADAGVRAVILTGAGRAFCAGGDIDAWSALSPEAFAMRWLRDGHAALDALARLRQPVIAALNGPALGGGLELAACADLRIAETQVTDRPAGALPRRDLRLVGHAARRSPLRRAGGAPHDAVRRSAFGAEEALRLGLVDHVVETGRALAKAREMARAAAARGPRAVQISKMTINAAEGEDRERAFDALAGGWAAHDVRSARGPRRLPRQTQAGFLRRLKGGPPMIRHFVLLRFRKDVSAETRAGLMRDLGAAVAAIEGCSGFASFPNLSVEAPLIHGFEHGFVVDFADEAARRRYLDDPGPSGGRRAACRRDRRAGRRAWSCSTTRPTDARRGPARAGAHRDARRSRAGAGRGRRDRPRRALRDLRHRSAHLRRPLLGGPAAADPRP